MTRKEQVIQMVKRLPEDVSYERLMYQVTLLKGIEIGREMSTGQDTDFEKLCRRIEREWEQSDLAPPTIEEIKAAMRGWKKEGKKTRKRKRSKMA